MNQEPFRVIYADCPWQFGDQLPGSGRGAEKHYHCMGVDELESFLVDENIPVADEAWLFFWRVAAMVPEALRVVKAWGFVPKSEIVWAKTRPCKKCNGAGFNTTPVPGSELSWQVWCKACEGRGWNKRIGMGRSVRNTHEICMIATRSPRKNSALSASAHDIASVIFANRHEHSKKPLLMYPLIERLTGNVTPRIELFARSGRPGWITRGLEAPEEGSAA